MVAQKVVEREGFFEKRVDLQTGVLQLYWPQTHAQARREGDPAT